MQVIPWRNVRGGIQVTVAADGTESVVRGEAI